MNLFSKNRKNEEGNAVLPKKILDKSKILKDIGIALLTSLILTFFAIGWYSGSWSSFSNYFSGDQILKLLAFFVIILMLMLACIGFIYLFDRKTLISTKKISLVMFAMVLVFVLSIIFADYLNIYAMPIALCAMLVGVLVSIKMAVIINIVVSQLLFLTISILAPLTQFSMSGLAGAILSNLASGFIMIALISKNFSRYKFVTSGLFSGIVVAPFVVLISYLIDSEPMFLLYNALWIVFANAFSVILFLPLLPICENVFGLLTDFKLDELASTDNKLLTRLKEEAPGTYNHSIMVSNLAVSCAYAIGVNTKLVKAAAMYHDVGKLVSPEYFVENQDGEYNPHDDLIPEVSAKMIIQHAQEGYNICKDYHIPDEIALTTLEHHGTIPVKYFYIKAQNIVEDKLDMSLFAYPGPKPTTKVSAIIMIVDTVEAVSRVGRPDDREEFEKLIDKLVKEKMDLKQFDDCDITMKDLNIIKQTLIRDIPSIYHGRIKYPEVGKK